MAMTFVAHAQYDSHVSNIMSIANLDFDDLTVATCAHACTRSANKEQTCLGEFLLFPVSVCL